MNALLSPLPPSAPSCSTCHILSAPSNTQECGHGHANLASFLTHQSKEIWGKVISARRTFQDVGWRFE
ncbi:hypothetical protein E2C01_064589 [Portunus trituberculatus]|uniref:Uncharacterized protein n=1 Tax=Portunus trituberculatus TaxID=210409 RepID=A0A5B7HL81_PORTR|nr:hypothetical protein [Portunus trituberculatus]